MEERFYSFNRYLRDKFGERVHRISLDAGFTCPNLDGTLSKEGCVYCNNSGFSFYSGSKKKIEAQIQESIEYYRSKGIKKFIAYFQAHTNTHADISTLKEKYDIIYKFPEIVGLAISTRPDCIDAKKLELISQYMDKYLVWVEYGLQTTHNHLLKNVNRNHTYEDFLRTVDLTRGYGINVGVHLILGLPGSTHNDMMEDARRISKLDVQGVKFHVLHVLKDTALEKMYRNGEVGLISKEEYIKNICDFLEVLSPRCVILRLVSTANTDYLVAPAWINQRNQVTEEIKQELTRRGTHQGIFYQREGRRL